MEETGGPQADGAGRRALVLAIALALATAGGVIALLAPRPTVAKKPAPAPSTGSDSVSVRFKDVRLDAQVVVVHEHGVGSCRGVLRASRSGLRFEASRTADSFDAPFAALEPLELDYVAHNLRVKQKGGETWSFSSDDADALLVFQKRVEAARARL